MPQFAGLDFKSKHAVPHRDVPAPHESEQLPCTQTSPALHFFPQLPQWSASRFVSMHLPLHIARLPPSDPHGPTLASAPPPSGIAGLSVPQLAIGTIAPSASTMAIRRITDTARSRI
jgi:hypothetical protein